MLLRPSRPDHAPASPRRPSVESPRTRPQPSSPSISRRTSASTRLFRYKHRISATVRAFRPDIIHITGPSENSASLEAYFAHQLPHPTRRQLAHQSPTNTPPAACAWLSRHLGGHRSQHRAKPSSLHPPTHRAALPSSRSPLYAPNPTLCTLLERTHPPSPAISCSAESTPSSLPQPAAPAPSTTTD